MTLRRKPIIWFTRDTSGYLLLNLEVPASSPDSQLILEDNYWMLTTGQPLEFECPPHGRLIHARYSNGDELRVEFFEITSEADLLSKYPKWNQRWSPILRFPITAVEILAQVPTEGISFNANSSRTSGVVMIGNLVSHQLCGLQLDGPPGQLSVAF